MLWIRGEVFDHGIFNTSVRWTVAKVLDYLSTLRPSTNAWKLTQSAWVEVTTLRCKPVLSESEAIAYWQVFTVLHESVVGRCGDAIDLRTVGVFLMCQVFHRARTNHIAQSEMWPSSERGPAATSPRQSMSPRGTSPRVVVSAQASILRGKETTVALLSFMRTHFTCFLQVVSFCLEGEATRVDAADFDLLAVILCAGSAFDTPYALLSEAVPDLATKGSIASKALKTFVEWALAWNEELYPSIDPSIAAPSHLAPMPGSGPTSALNITGVNKATWFQQPVPAEVGYLNITSCTDAVIYFTSKARFCLISGCHDCTIILGAVSSLCTLQNCEKVSVHVAAHCFKSESSTDSSAYLFCHLPPILTGDTRGIKLAPFNVLYSGMDSILERGNLTLDPGYVDTWAKPICCTLGSPDETLGGRSGSYDESNSTSYHFVHPNNFQPVIVPEPGAVALPGSRLCLPQVYDDALKERVAEMQRFHRQLAELTDAERRRSAQQAIQGHFREWLQATGKSRQLADLARMAMQEQAA